MSEPDEFNLEQIIKDSLKETNKMSPDACAHLISLSKEQLLSRLTPAQTKEIAKDLIEKMGVSTE